MGRPSKFSDAYVEEVVTYCAQGYSLTAFAGSIGVCRDTISEWCNEHPEFSASVSRAKAKRAEWWETQALEVAKTGGTGGRATMIIFGLKNHAPDDFKEISRQETTGANGGPIATTLETERTVEAKRAEARRMVEEAFGRVAEQKQAPLKVG